MKYELIYDGANYGITGGNICVSNISPVKSIVEDMVAKFNNHNVSLTHFLECVEDAIRPNIKVSHG